jgi:hypothetical protein
MIPRKCPLHQRTRFYLARVLQLLLRRNNIKGVFVHLSCAITAMNARIREEETTAASETSLDSIEGEVVAAITEGIPLLSPVGDTPLLFPLADLVEESGSEEIPLALLDAAAEEVVPPDAEVFEADVEEAGEENAELRGDKEDAKEEVEVAEEEVDVAEEELDVARVDEDEDELGTMWRKSSTNFLAAAGNL